MNTEKLIEVEFIQGQYGPMARVNGRSAFPDRRGPMPKVGEIWQCRMAGNILSLIKQGRAEPPPRMAAFAVILTIDTGANPPMVNVTENSQGIRSSSSELAQIGSRDGLKAIEYTPGIHAFHFAWIFRNGQKAAMDADVEIGLVSNGYDRPGMAAWRVTARLLDPEKHAQFKEDAERAAYGFLESEMEEAVTAAAKAAGLLRENLALPGWDHQYHSLEEIHAALPAAVAERLATVPAATRDSMFVEHVDLLHRRHLKIESEGQSRKTWALNYTGPDEWAAALEPGEVAEQIYSYVYYGDERD